MEEHRNWTTMFSYDLPPSNFLWNLEMEVSHI